MITVSAESIYPGLLVFFRASGLLLLLPVFSGANIPAPVRIAVAGFLAILLTPLLGELGGMPSHALLVGVAVGHELLAGLLMGLAARLLFYALEMGGQIISNEIGLTLSTNIDPISQNLTTPPATLLYAFGTLLFLISGAHHHCLLAFARSFEVFPTTAAFDPQAAEYVVARSGRVFLIAVQIAAPLLAANFLVNLAFAALGRAAPSLDVYAASFPVRILAGLAVFSLTLPLIARHVLAEFEDVGEVMLRFLR